MNDIKELEMRILQLKRKAEEQKKVIDDLEVERDYLREKAEQLTERLNEISAIYEAAGRKILEMVNKKAGPMKEHLESIEKRIREDRQDFEKQIKDIVRRMDLVFSRLSELEGRTDSLQERFNDVIEELHGEAKVIANQMERTVSKNLKEMEGNLDVKLKNIETHLESEMKSWSTEIEKKEKVFDEEVARLREERREIDERFSKLENDIKNLEDRAMERIEEAHLAIEELSKVKERLKGEIGAETDGKLKEMKRYVENKLSDIGKSVKELESEISKRIIDEKKSLERMIHENETSLLKDIEEIDSSTSERIKRLNESLKGLSETTKSIGNEVKAIQKDMKDFRKSVTGIEKELNEKMVSVQKGLEREMTVMRKEFGDKFNVQAGEISEIEKRIEMHVKDSEAARKNFEDSLKSEVDRTLEEMKAKAEDEITALKKDVAERIVALEGVTQRRVEEVTGRLEEELNRIEMIESRLKEQEKKERGDFLQLGAKLDTSLESLRNEFHGLLNESLEGLKEEVMTATSQNIASVRSDITSRVDSLESEMNEGKNLMNSLVAVSYTHLTLPTKA